MNTLNALSLRNLENEVAPNFDPLAEVRSKQRTTVVALALLVLLFGVGGALIPLGGAVIASGQVGVESRVKRISHPVGGVISQINVENGQHVKKGQELILFDDRVSGADAEFSSLTVDQLLAQRARLEAERLGASSIVFPKILHRGDSGARQAMADEEKTFRLRNAEQQGLASQLGSRIAQYQQQIGAYQSQITALQRQSALIEPERRGVKELWEKDLVTINRLNQLERTAVDMEGSMGALRANIAQTQARITEAREQIIQLRESRRSDAGTQLAQINATLNQQQIRSVSASDAHDRSVVRAPYDGVIDKLAFNTIGGVVKPAEIIMEIVPDTDQLLVEGAVSPADIDQVHSGQNVRIRFTAFSATTTPEISGKLIYVAAERSTDAEGKMSFYPVRIVINERELDRYPKMVLKPGMPAELFIETGQRTMLSYVTKPLQDQFQRAFRDN